MNVIEALFELFWPFIMIVVVFVVVARAKKRLASQSTEQSTTGAATDLEVNPFDVLKAMLTGDVEAIKALEKKAEAPKQEKQTHRQVSVSPPEGIQPLMRKSVDAVYTNREKTVEKRKKETVKEVIQEKTDRQRISLSQTKQELRKAVIWAEILAPPLALREE